uniref:Uncharacterized protein n=1 Tax=mine drainage metagenome TaxID=410659 RepID=E6PTN0_9ZZZZ
MIRQPSLRLPQHWRIGDQPALGKLPQDLTIRTWFATWLVDIFDAYQPLAAMRARIEPGRQRSQQGAGMQRARWRGCKTADIAHRSLRFGRAMWWA